MSATSVEKPASVSVAVALAACTISPVVLFIARFGEFGRWLGEGPGLTIVMSFPSSLGSSMLPEYVWLVVPYLLAGGFMWRARSERSASRLAVSAVALVTAPSLAYSLWHLAQQPAPHGTVTLPVRVSYAVAHLLPLWQYFVLLWLGVLLAGVPRRAVDAAGPTEHAGVAFRLWRAVLVFIPAATVVLLFVEAAVPSSCCWTCGEVPGSAIASLFTTFVALGPLVAVAALSIFFERSRLPRGWVMGFSFAALAPVFLAAYTLATANTSDGQGAMGIGILVGFYWAVGWLLTLTYAVAGFPRLIGPDRAASRWRLGLLTMALLALFVAAPFIVGPSY